GRHGVRTIGLAPLPDFRVPRAAPSARVEPSRTGTCFALVRSAVPVGCIARGASRRRPMQTLRRTVAVLIFPAIAYLGAACERTDTPTGAALPPAALQLSSGDDRWVNLVGVPNPPGSSCIDPGYNSIGAAVAASTSGDIIHVCAGMYNENVVINNVSLTSLTLLGAQAGTPVATRAFGGPLESTVKGSMLMVDAPV